MVLLHEASLDEIASLGSSVCSDTARRLTNLFVPAAPILVGDAVVDRGLVHRTERGELVRSKSEVIIANILHQMNATYGYEDPFTGSDGRTVRPDFTITTDLGETVLWEHLGMLADPRYAAKWAAKKAWYTRNGVVPADEGDGLGTGTRLIVTDDREGVDVPGWKQLAAKVLGF